MSAALVAAVLGGCEREGGGAAPPPPPSGERAESAATTGKKVVTVEEFCDVHPEAAAAPKAQLPPLAAGSHAPAAGTWRWLNVWATWCVPCIEEMPRLARWQKELGAQGMKFDLVFLSVDDTEDLVSKFRQEHPGTPPSLRISQPDALQKWLALIGLGEGAPIPVHVFIDPADKIRCVRAGGVREADLPAVRAVLGSG
jgi:cytochrome c biogenesis protein CcmG/thiol:disulfide interchange protein DsbE